MVFISELKQWQEILALWHATNVSVSLIQFTASNGGWKIVPVPVSMYKAEAWRHLGFCGNVYLSSAACCVLYEKPLRGLGCSAARLQLSLVLGAFCAVGAVLALWFRRFHAEHKYKLKNLRNPSWKVLRMFNVYLLFCFAIVLFSLGILQALYFSLIRSRCICFLFRSKCYDIVYHNCKLKLWTFKAGSKNIYCLFIKYI